MHIDPVSNKGVVKLVCACVLGVFLTGCGGGSSSGSGGSSPDQEALFVAVANSIYSNVLVACVVADRVSQSCTLSTLPLLGQQTNSPSVDDILARTVISDAWMANRFREFLERLPADALPLFKAVTAVVIAGDIRPSFYTNLTGAIYIDPARFWLTNAEKNTISTAADFRADFGDSLSFVSLFRYVEGNDYAWEYFPLDGNETRTINDIVRPLAALLFHELAHANDVFPPARISSLDSTRRVVEAADAIAAFGVSETLAAAQPLVSDIWFGLGEVLYAGFEPTTAQRALSAGQVGLEFETDGASDDYAYSSIYEDTAMLFEEVMMHHYYGIDREIAYTNMPPSNLQPFCDSYVVGWGYRNRVNDVLVRFRAELVLQQLLDELDVSPYFAGLGSPQKMVNGLTWCTVQNLSATPVLFAEANAQSTEDVTKQRLRPDNRRRRH
jgi:hypothetical protein